jgi:phosphoribosylanthranilate isomerase
MDATRRPRLKICCIQSVDEARLAIEAGASALGLVSAMPSGPGVASDEVIAEVARFCPPGVATFLLTSRCTAEGILEQQRRSPTTAVQICDAPEPGTYAALRRELPWLKIVQVVHVTGEESVTEAVEAAPFVDALLLDSGNPKLAVKELGGTGRRHDWSLSRRIREAAPVPLWLAGGLNASNVAEAIQAVGPFGLDVCSGVRTNGSLDRDKVRTLAAAALQAG